MTGQTTETTEQRPDLGALLDRVYRSTARPRTIETDGREYFPAREVERIAHELGYDRKTTRTMNPTLESLHGKFELDEDWAQWHKRQELATRLRVLRKAGADSADLDVLREALGLEEKDEDLADHLDERNEQARLFWLQRGAAHFAHAMANAQEDGRREVLADLQVLAGSGLLQKRDGNVGALVAGVHRDAGAIRERGVTALDNALATAEDGQWLTVSGTLASVTKRATNQGRDWASAMLVDGGEVEILIFPSTYEQVARWLAGGKRVELTGQFDSWGGLPRLKVKRLTVQGHTGTEDEETASVVSA